MHIRYTCSIIVFLHVIHVIRSLQVLQCSHDVMRKWRQQLQLELREAGQSRPVKDSRISNPGRNAAPAQGLLVVHGAAWPGAGSLMMLIQLIHILCSCSSSVKAIPVSTEIKALGSSGFVSGNPLELFDFSFSPNWFIKCPSRSLFLWNKM